ncbi:hypothetical protein ACOMHN_014514 [Nucella lapillus]
MLELRTGGPVLGQGGVTAEQAVEGQEAQPISDEDAQDVGRQPGARAQGIQAPRLSHRHQDVDRACSENRGQLAVR